MNSTGSNAHEIADRFAEADQLHRQAELGFDREHDPALGRTVELGQHDAGHLRRVAELARLGEAVLPRRRVDHQQHLGDPAGTLGGDPAHLAQLLHQVRLGVQATGRVAEHEIDVARGRAFDRVEDDCAGIATLVAANEFGATALCPRAELLDGRGAERIAGSHQHRSTDGGLLGADLADRRGLADTVDADEQPHVGTTWYVLEVERAISARQTVDHLGLQRVEELRGFGDLLRLHLHTQTSEQIVGHSNADIGAQQRLFEVVPRLVGDAASRADPEQGSGQRTAGLRHATAEVGTLDDCRLGDRLGSLTASGSSTATVPLERRAPLWRRCPRRCRRRSDEIGRCTGARGD